MKYFRNIFDIYNLSNIIYMCKYVCISVTSTPPYTFKAARVTTRSITTRSSCELSYRLTPGALGTHWWGSVQVLLLLGEGGVGG